MTYRAKEQIDNGIRLLIRRSPLASILRKYFRRSPIEHILEVGRKHGWPQAASFLLSNKGLDSLKLSEFQNLFKDDINTDIEYEYLLTELRKLILLSSFDLSEKPVTDIVQTLITQAHHNEFVWYISDDEKNKIRDIAARVATPSDNYPSASDIILLSMYGRLGQIYGLSYATHKNALAAVSNIPNELSKVLDSYIIEHDEQLDIKNNLSQLGHIENETSKQIANNYEEYPYPRWIVWGFPKPGTRINKLREFFSEKELDFTSRPFNLLVAGCGTGSKAIEYAIGYGENASITAIDLSLTSLSYAKWMAKKLNINNIDFVQMDLLDLPNIGREFDIVECTGVLHHMKDPVEGARAIISPVRKSGLVHISLYSELARQSILELRDKYNLTPGMANDEIRSKRQVMMKNDRDLIDNRLSLRWDFFDLNRCKDLLFHPLEHRYTVPMIEKLLSEANLEFRGIERPAIIRTHYWTKYPAKHEVRNLQKWHEFELRYPSAFGNLYEIWALK